MLSKLNTQHAPTSSPYVSEKIKLRASTLHGYPYDIGSGELESPFSLMTYLQ